MAVFKCKMCGGDLEIIEGKSVAECRYCGTLQTLPKLDDDRKSNMFDRANHFRRNNEYDKAMSIYEKLLEEDSTDAEIYWSIVLCRYGIEYVEDPATHKRVPTVNRAQYSSVVSDKDYKSALKYGTPEQKELYKAEARAIDKIQKGILEISQKEEPFDVFICYKETDNQGRRTPDSVLANDLYHQLVQEGFKVFFSRITLEDKLGTAYEPYIFAALNSAKVMVVLGTKPEYFNAVWVKNEWSRYLALVNASSGKKMLIPAYKDMDPYDLPEEFSHLQAQDMSKLGFMQDLIRGIKKIVSADTPATVVKETLSAAPAVAVNTAPLLERAFMFLEDGDWEDADTYCEKVLDQDPKNAHAYLGKLMAELKVRKQEDLKNCGKAFDTSSNYQKAVRFGDDSFAEQLKADNEENQKYICYNEAISSMNAAYTDKDFLAAADKFKQIQSYKDAADCAEACIAKAEELKQERLEKEEATRLEAERKAEEKRIQEEKAKQNTKIALPSLALLIALMVILNTVIIPQVKYKKALKLLESNNEVSAMGYLNNIGNYKKSKELMMDVNAETISAGYKHTVGLKSDGTVIATEYTDNQEAYDGQCDVDDWKDIVSVSAGSWHTVGLKSDGTVVATGDNNDGQCNVDNWKNIVAVSAGSSYTVGLKSDGTVVATVYTGHPENYHGQCNVSRWKDIVAVSAGFYHTVGLKSDGTVVATEYTGDPEYYHGECDVSEWKGIVAVSAGEGHTVGLKSDGTVVATEYTGDPKYYHGECDVSEWKGIVAVSAGEDHTVGLKSDGTVVATEFIEDQEYFYFQNDGQCYVDNWKNIVAVSAGRFHTVGVKSDGTVVATGYDYYGQCDVDEWKDIKVPKELK